MKQVVPCFISTPFTSSEVHDLLDISPVELADLTSIMLNGRSWVAADDPMNRIGCFNVWDIIELYFFRATSKHQPNQRASRDFAHYATDSLARIFEHQTHHAEEALIRIDIQKAALEAADDHRWACSFMTPMMVSEASGVIMQAMHVSSHKIWL